MNTVSTSWINAISLADLRSKGKTVVRHKGKQIALFATELGVFACNNRCPHEGYPLREGSLDENCILTCNWHNWKFDLADGRNLYGGDRLRTYPVDIREDDVWLDISDPPYEHQYAELMQNLRHAMEDNSYDRMAREIGRLHLLGADFTDAIRAAIEWTYQRLEFGWTHAYAGAADWLTLYDEHVDDPETQLICILESVAHIADDTLRESKYPYSEDRQEFNEQAFLAAIETCDENHAQALLRGAVAQGLHFVDLERLLSQAALAHYNDFGHALIYVTKAGKLIDRLGAEVELPLLQALVRSLAFSSREDLIPEFRGYADALQNWNSRNESQTPSWQAFQSLTINKALKQTVAFSGASSDQSFAALLGANTSHMLAYDLSYQHHIDKQIDDNVGWLSFTHSITFANAVRKQCTRFPELWAPGLLQLACFCGRNFPYTDYRQSRNEWLVDDYDSFYADSIDELFDHGKEEFIVSVHLLKTLLAAREETAVADGETKQLVTGAMNRFLHSPLKRKHVRRTVRQAMKFVARDA